ncbi:MAG: YqcI/YcgG family protein [Rhodospirillales bacterium]|nr:YqcI/YcgG family protein [Rhodospirillales bacterium]
MDTDLKPKFEEFIRQSDFPCVGAKSALANGVLSVVNAARIDHAGDDRAIYAALVRFGRSVIDDAAIPQSLAVAFRGPLHLSETAFEDALWERLQSLHDLDMAGGVPWDEAVASDPAAPEFSMSVGGRAFFVVGLHPQAGRLARRFKHPVMVFNPHAQFERLRANGKYDRMRTVIRNRDRAVQGDVNPMVENFGSMSEARQYSGRIIDDAWQCPFSLKIASERKKAGALTKVS